MHYKRIYPSIDIKNLVCFFWEFEGLYSEREPYEHVLTASISPKLAFLYSGMMQTQQNNTRSPLFKSGFQCQTQVHLQISATSKVGIFGIYFQPFAIPLLFGTPAHVLTNLNIEISDLLGNEGSALEERIMTCNNTDERVRTVTSFLAKKIKDDIRFNKDIIATVDFITHHKGNVDMRELVSKNFLSQRQFERKFKSLIGFSPKLFSKIVRFEACLSHAVSINQPLGRLALDSGYYDQSHMIRDFKEFSGKHPRSYLSEIDSFLFE